MPEQRTRITDKLASLRGQAWVASARKISQWWRNREHVAVKLEPRPEGYVVSAKVAGAVTMQEPLSIWVDLPHPNARVRLQALQGGDKLPEVTVVDPGRVAISWRAPAAGDYAWLLKFEEPANHGKR